MKKGSGRMKLSVNFLVWRVMPLLMLILRFRMFVCMYIEMDFYVPVSTNDSWNVTKESDYSER